MIQTKLEGLVFVVEGSKFVVVDVLSLGPVGDERSLGCLNMLMTACHLKVM